MRVLILGAGFGGLELATSLSEVLGDQVEVTLIDKNNSFVFGYSKLDVMFGKAHPDAIRIPYCAISKPGVTFRQESILSIDPVQKRVVTEREVYEGDILVVALGADFDTSATPGLNEWGNEFYSVTGAEKVREFLPSFKGGKVVIALTTPHYKCPPAPSECAMLMDDYLVELGVRDRSTITFVSPLPTPLPVSAEVGATILAQLNARAVTFIGGTRISGFEDGGRFVRFADGGGLESDLILSIPHHVAPKVVLESGMTENGWIPTDKYTLQTRYPGVFAYGDVASVGVPRAGIFAEGQARVVARQIIGQFHREPDTSRYDGAGICYLEVGQGMIGKVDVNFLSGSSTSAAIEMPSLELRGEKIAFGSTRRARWFGLAS